MVTLNSNPMRLTYNANEKMEPISWMIIRQDSWPSFLAFDVGQLVWVLV